MKFNGQNVIADSDIVMTGLLAGHNLSEVLNQHDKDISNLKSNVKWIYKYGGVGSGSGGGGGSASNTPWNFKVEIDDVIREKNTQVNLGQLREYRLTIQFFKVLGRSFEIQCTYNTPTGIAMFTRLISPTQSPTLTEIIDLQVNGTLSIAINDDEGNYDLFIMDYIVTAYSFNLDYVYANDRSVFYPDNNNIFVSAVNEKGGLMARLTLIISVEAKHYYIEYLDWNGVTHTIEPDVLDNYCYLELGKDINNENSGNYTFSVTPHLILSGNNEEENIQMLKLSDNLIPDTIYLKVRTNGTLYETDLIEDPNLFYAGAITFFLTGFLGFPDKTSNYAFKVWINDVLYEDVDLPTDLQDLTEYEMAIRVSDIGWNKITFLIKRKNATYEKTYYLNTRSALGSFNWYPDQTIDGKTERILPEVSYQYNYINGSTHNGAKTIDGLNHRNLILRVSYTSTSEYVISDLKQSSKDKLDCLMCVGIKFSKLSDLTKPIMAFKGYNSTYDITIYQNKITTLGDTYEPFYIPMDGEFHLLSIYKRAVAKIGNAETFEYVFYIDGVIELVLPSFQSLAETYRTITLLQGCLYDINYLEISYFNHTLQPNDGNLDSYEVFNPNPNKIRITHLVDSHILYHYYSYRLSLNPTAISSDFLTAYSYVSLFYNNTKTGNIEVTAEVITLLATAIEVPVLRIKYVENKSTDSSVVPGEELMDWIKRVYDITDESVKTLITKGKTVSVAYSSGDGLGLKNIDISRFPNALFKLFLQGTSTLLYTGKNFDLAIEGSANDTYTYLYTPNYVEGNFNTFLPEKRFTLKADIVDSSHSNNNAIGKFINTIATKFLDGQLTSHKYNGHLKNTLEGFPVLLFLENAYFKTPTSQATTSDYYFLGIYNFNLGRDSEYNLGFKDLRLLPDNMSSGFQVIQIDNDLTIGQETISTNSYVSGLGVMEINENRTYFDFSLSDETVLFKLSDSETDNDYMFSKFKSNNVEGNLKPNIAAFVEKVRLAGGYLFESYLGKNLLDKKDSTDTYGYGYDEGYKTAVPKNIVPNYRMLFTRTFVDSKSVLTPKTSELSPSGDATDLINLLIGNVDENIMPVLDYQSLSEYYVICMALGLLDSVLKNMNFRCWRDKFYLAFYDMDTALGKDNAGNNSEYVCFSDYWKSNSVVQGGSTILQPAISYKDWYDVNVAGGYDIPSSYLFAIAKYAHGAMETGDDALKDWYPPNVWARFRRKNSLYWDTKPLGTNDAHIGCLPNADAFIDNYFAKHLEKVPDVVFNLNYRAKYLMLDKEEGTSLYSYEDRRKFSGRRVHYVRDWLNSRFHLLDLYFNLAGIADTIYKYNLTTETWEPKGTNLDYKTPDATFIDNENEDILVKQDAFTSGNSNSKYSRNIDLTFTADTHSPLSLTGAVTGRYLTETNTTPYKLFVESNGKSIRLGGSKAWLTISSINTLIQEGAFYASSTKLTSLAGTEGLCSSWTLNLPALKSLTLNSPNYAGKLSFSGLTLWPNLTSIDIKGTKLSLNLDSIKVTSIDASGVSGADELTILNCNSLTHLNLESSVFNKINIVTKLQISYYSTYKYELQLDGSWKLTTEEAKPPKCETLSIKCTHANKGIIFISDLIFNSDEKGLKEITLEGFKEVYIDNCPYLSKVTINDKDNLEKIEITNSASSSSSLSVGSLELNTVNLEDCTKLTHINFKSCKKFKYVYLPDNINLPEQSFYYTNIQYLSGNNLKLNPKVFWYCTSFTLLQNDKTSLCSFDKNHISTDLLYLFSHNDITIETFAAFNTAYATLLENVTNALYMWWNTKATTYTPEMLLEDYKDNSCRFDLSMYANVSNAQGMLGGDRNTACHPDILEGLGANSTTLNLTNFYGWAEKANAEVTVPLNWLEHVKTKVLQCSCSTDSVIYKVVEYDSSTESLKVVTQFNPKDFFGGNIENKLTSITNWKFFSEHIIDLQNSFTTDNFPALTTITKSFINCAGKNLEFGQEGNKKGFLFGNTKLINISGSFGFTNAANLTVALDTYLDWENLPNNYQGFLYVVNWDEKYNVMAFNKTLNNVANFNTIMNTLLVKYTGKLLAGVFRNCVILNGNDQVLFDSTKSNSKIQQIPYLFSNLKAQNSASDDTLINLKWDWNCMQTLPAVTALKHTFEGIQFAGYIPFNFFKRRLETSKLVYVKNGSEQFEEATLYTYVYSTANNKITDLTYCFSGCTFEIPMFIEYNFDILNSSRLVQNGIVLDTNKYYLAASLFANEEVVRNPEFEDLNKEVAFAASLNTFFQLIRLTVDLSVVESYDNWEYLSVYDRINFPVIPPDFFYACSTGPNLESCFANTNLQGYIPDNLFINCTASSIKIANFLKDALIFPKLYDVKYDANGLVELDIYYYIGSNFCKAASLDNAFNFKIHLPGTVTIEDDTVTKNQLHVFCFSDSFSTLMTSMKNALPLNIREPKDGCKFMLYHLPNNIYLNPMYDKSTEYNYVVDEGTGEAKQILGNLGFDLVKYKQLNADNLINLVFSLFMYGRAFDSNTTLQSIKRTSKSNWVFLFGSDSLDLGVSANGIWPSTNAAVNNIIKTTHTAYVEESGNFKPTTGSSIRVYKTKIENYIDGVTNTHYNNSRVNKNLATYGLTFI